MVHQTNSTPVLRDFIINTGKLWLDDNTPRFDLALNDLILIRQAVVNTWVFIRVTNGSGGSQYRAVFWGRPAPIAGVQTLRKLIRECIRRSNVRAVPGDPRPSPRNLPNVNVTYRGCSECNDIMTQEETMRHLLARDVINPVPLVPLQSIYRYNLTGNPFSNFANTRVARMRPTGGPNSRQERDPNLQNRSNIYFSFPATIAYYIHRCLRTRPVHANPRVRSIHLLYKQFDVTFAYYLLEICCLMFERNFGCEGGVALRNKPAFRYRGLIELYISHILWTLPINDVAKKETTRRWDWGF